jgi:chemotaxis protein methyltransferase CheR
MASAPNTPVDTAAASYALRDADFERVRKLIHRHAGIALSASKRSMVYSRLSRRLRVLGKTSFASYLDALESDKGDGKEWQEFVNALTTNLTSFFREEHHFPLLAELLVKRAAQAPLQLWCSAASTGEEPYTMAITAMEAFGTMTPPVSIVATDIDTAVLNTARAGVYRDDVVAKLEPALLKRYFLRGAGARAGFVQVRPEVRALVQFQQLNLLDRHLAVDGPFDAIFCRNVMIYFDKPTQDQVLAKLAERLIPQGLLFAGHSENFSHARDLFVLRGKTVYQRVLAPPHAKRLAA